MLGPNSGPPRVVPCFSNVHRNEHFDNLNVFAFLSHFLLQKSKSIWAIDVVEIKKWPQKGFAKSHPGVELERALKLSSFEPNQLISNLS